MPSYTIYIDNELNEFVLAVDGKNISQKICRVLRIQKAQMVEQ